MWDEKKFFEDFVEESDKIKPDARFVEQLKSMATQEEKKKKPIPMIKYAAAAASFVLCIGLGALVWHSQSTGSMDEGLQQEAELQAGGQDADTEIQSGTVSEKLEDPLKTAMDYMKQGIDVTDAEGNAVSQDQQQDLLNALKQAKPSDEAATGAVTQEYNLKGELTVQIWVYEDGAISINGENFIVK